MPTILIPNRPSTRTRTQSSSPLSPLSPVVSSPSSPTNWYPRLTGKIDPEAEAALRVVFDNLYFLRDQIKSPNTTDASTTPSTTPSTSPSSPLPVLFGTHDDRLSNYPPDTYTGRLYAETDRRTLYYSDGDDWVLITGVLSCTQSDIASLGLGSNDAGMRVYVTDYQHTLLWSGDSFSFSPDDSGSGFVVLSATGSAPYGGVWGVCNGSSYNVLKPDGTLQSTTSPTAANNYLRR